MMVLAGMFIPSLLLFTLTVEIGKVMANKPNNPALWAKVKAQAKKKFDVYPSAYANAWAAKQYKAAGGTWKAVRAK